MESHPSRCCQLTDVTSFEMSQSCIPIETLSLDHPSECPVHKDCSGDEWDTDLEPEGKTASGLQLHCNVFTIVRGIVKSAVCSRCVKQQGAF